jgi:hypothetical protein
MPEMKKGQQSREIFNYAFHLYSTPGSFTSGGGRRSTDSTSKNDLSDSLKAVIFPLLTCRA